MFDKIFVVGYDDDGRAVVVFNDFMNEEQTCKHKGTCLCLHRIFAEKESHKLSIVLNVGCSSSSSSLLVTNNFHSKDNNDDGYNQRKKYIFHDQIFFNILSSLHRHRNTSTGPSEDML